MKSRILPIIATTMIAAAGLTSCGNNGCEEVRESYCLATFESRTGSKLTSLDAWGLGQISDKSNDSITYTDLMLALTSPSEMEIKLNPNDTITRLYMEIKSSYYGTVTKYTDTLTIRYQVDPYFIDMECGCTVYFTISSAEVSGNFFQLVNIRNKTVTNETSTNLQLEY